MRQTGFNCDLELTRGKRRQPKGRELCVSVHHSSSGRERVDEHIVSVLPQTKSNNLPAFSLFSWPEEAVPCAVTGGAVRR